MNAPAPSPFARALRSAILGTQHAAPDVTTGDAQLDAVLAARDGEPPERTLLRAAATIGAMERAGTPPGVVADADVEAVVDVRARCGPRAADDLRTILASDRAEALDEWLALANRFERRAPEESLPELLSRGARTPGLRGALHAVVDTRGRWLAAHEPRWAYATGAVDDGTTYDEAGSIAARTAALRRLREANPEAARARLESTFATEQPADRAALLAALETSLSAADEPFLVSCQDDKRRETRHVAADLLTRLPASAATLRLAALAEPLLRVERHAHGRLRLAVTLPEACTPAMQRDGVEPKPARPGIGERAWWLEQLLAATPPQRWPAALHVPTGERFELALESEYAEAAVRGFAIAIRRFRDADALGALLAVAVHQPRLLEAYALADHDALATEAREPAVRAALRHRHDGADVVLGALRAPWSLELSRDALAYARSSIDDAGDWNAFRRRSELLRTIAARVDPRTPNVRSGWPESFRSERVRDLVDATLAAIEFRVGLFEHFADDA